MSNGDTESQEETRGNEHLEVDGDGLQNDSGYHDDAADDDSPASSKSVRNVWNDGQGDERTNGHDGSEKT